MIQVTSRKPAKQLINAMGLTCPEPLMLVHEAINKIDPGETIEIIGDDPTSVRDINQLCHFLKHRVVFVDESSESFTVVIEKQNKSCDH